MRIKYKKIYQSKKKKSIFKNRFFWLTIFILLVLGGSFYLIFFAPFFQIKEIKISGNQRVAESELRKIIEEKIKEPILFFPSKTIFLINHQKIENDVMEKFPQIFQINFQRKFPHLLIVEVKERKARAIFLNNGHQFLMDERGVVFEEIFQNDLELLKIKIQNPTSPLRLGEKVISQEELSLILDASSKLKEIFNIIPKEVLVLSKEQFNLKTSEGWEIYFNSKGDIKWQLMKLKALFENEINAESRKNLEYIDLRFGNLVPYKYKKQ